MNCPSCQRALQDDFKFCPHCGVQIANNCYSCGKQVDPAWVSCPHCGVGLKGRASQHQPANPPPPQQQYPRNPYQHGYHQGSSSYSKRHRKGFLGRIFSS